MGRSSVPTMRCVCGKPTLSLPLHPCFAHPSPPYLFQTVHAIILSRRPVDIIFRDVTSREFRCVMIVPCVESSLFHPQLPSPPTPSCRDAFGFPCTEEQYQADKDYTSRMMEQVGVSFVTLLSSSSPPPFPSPLILSFPLLSPAAVAAA
jgi:hypothetical protein